MEKLIPQLRFPEFKEEWNVRLLKNVLKIGNGKDYKHLNPGEIPVYGTGGIMCYVDNFLYNGPSVGIGRKGTIDKPIRLGGKFWTVDTLFYTHSFSNIEVDFIFALFQKINWKSYNEASGVPSLSKSSIERIEIYIPSLEEQTKIANFLGKVDKQIEILTSKKEKLEAYKKGTMQQLFNQELRFKKDDGSNYPDWEEKKLGEIAEVIMGQSPDSNSYNNDGVGLPLIQGNADIKNRISLPRQFTSKPTKTSEIGSILFTVRAPVGYVGKNNIKSCIGRGVCSINSFFNNEFLYQYLLWIEDKWDSKSQGSTFSAINSQELKRTKIFNPFLEEQTKIANFLSAIDRQIEQVDKQIDKTKAFKKGLLQQMFV